MTRMEELDRLIRMMPLDKPEPIEKRKRKPRFAFSLGMRYTRRYGSREFWGQQAKESKGQQ